jgi:hypothetical protein
MDYKLLIQSKLTEFHKDLPDLSYGEIWYSVLSLYRSKTEFKKTTLLEIPDETLYNYLCKVYVREMGDSEMSEDEWDKFLNRLEQKMENNK